MQREFAVKLVNETDIKYLLCAKQYHQRAKQNLSVLKELHCSWGGAKRQTINKSLNKQMNYIVHQKITSATAKINIEQDKDIKSSRMGPYCDYKWNNPNQASL